MATLKINPLVFWRHEEESLFRGGEGNLGTMSRQNTLAQNSCSVPQSSFHCVPGLILPPWAWLFIEELLGWPWSLWLSSHCPLSSSVLYEVGIPLGLPGYLLSSSHWESGPASCTLKLMPELAGTWHDPLPTVLCLVLRSCVTLT